MILYDIDGCLLCTNGKIPNGYYDGLRRLHSYIRRANGGNFPKIGFCTGRDRNYVEATAFAVGLPNSWSVIESGIAIFNPATKELVPNPALTEEILAAFREISQNRLPLILRRFPGLFLYPGNAINIALELRHGNNDPIDSYYKQIIGELTDLLESGLVNITFSPIAVDIMPAGIDKAGGALFLARYTGADLKQSLGVGDSNGDIGFLCEMGFIGCPSNANEACKEVVRTKGGYISPLSYAQGVADITHHFTTGS